MTFLIVFSYRHDLYNDEEYVSLIRYFSELVLNIAANNDLSILVVGSILEQYFQGTTVVFIHLLCWEETVSLDHWMIISYKIRTTPTIDFIEVSLAILTLLCNPFSWYVKFHAFSVQVRA